MLRKIRNKVLSRKILVPVRLAGKALRLVSALCQLCIKTIIILFMLESVNLLVKADKLAIIQQLFIMYLIFFYLCRNEHVMN